MELSGNKSVLRLTELACGGQVLCAGALAILVRSGLVEAGAAKIPTMTLFCLTFPIFFVAAKLQNEFLEARGVERSWWRDLRGLSWTEIRMLMRWCPRPMAYASLPLIACGIAYIFFEGGIGWSSGQPFTPHHAVGFNVGSMAFGAAAFPPIASASRMPGVYSDHFEALDSRT